MQKVAIWDLAVRLFHWSLAVLIVTNLIIGGDEAGLYTLHVYLGYAALLLVVFRLLWGLIGSSHARFGDFVVGPRTALTYAVELVRGSVRPHRGHTPLGGYMIVALLLTVLAQAVTGVLSASGSHWAEDVHEILPNVLIALVALHVLGVIVHSWRARENIVGPMITGRKELTATDAQGEPLLKPGRRSLAAAAGVLLLGGLAAWQIDLPRLAEDSEAGEGGESGEGGEGGESGEGGERSD